MANLNFKNLLDTRRPEKIFLILAVPLVALFILVIPPLQGWDETTHFLRAYQISAGDLISEQYGTHAGGPIPDNIVDMNDAAVNDIILSAKTDLSRKVNISSYSPFIRQNHPTKAAINKYFSGSAAYSPVSYAPHAIGIYTARTLRLPLITYDYAARFVGAAVFVILAYFAIKISPRGKWAIFAIAMMPTSLAAAATLSPDALVNGGALLLIAFVLKGIFDSKPLSNRDLIIMTAIILLLALSKQIYFLFALLPLCIPIKNGFGSLKRYLGWTMFFIMGAFLVTFLWYAQVNEILKFSYLESRPGLHVNPSQQTSYIIAHPLTYTGTLLWELFGHSNPKYTQLAGMLTWKGIVMPYVAIFTVYLSLILAFVLTYYEKSKTVALSRIQRVTSSTGPILLGAVLVVLIYTALYISFSIVGGHEIEGVQGRYFIPLIGLLIPAVALFKPKKSEFKLGNSNIGFILCVLFLLQNIVALFVIFATCYIPHMQFV